MSPVGPVMVPRGLQNRTLLLGFWLKKQTSIFHLVSPVDNAEIGSSLMSPVCLSLTLKSVKRLYYIHIFKLYYFKVDIMHVGTCLETKCRKCGI